ncbi:hypothetical protein A5647_06210 [Mycobacterium sp. 1100029.7]|nr:hypothetical protein A5647_06210 [Mycobacterium sp. 1100029.7]
MLAIAAVVVLVPAALVGFFVIKDIAHDGLDGRGGTKKASALSDFDVVCDRGSISNAASYGKPYKIVAFAPDVRPSPMSQVSHDHWTELTPGPRADYRANANEFQAANVVACLTQKAGTEVKSRSCDFKTDAGDNVTVDYYAVQYNIELREAKTGKHIEDLGTVDGPAARCPFLLWVNKRDHKMYAEPDDAAVEAKLAEFANR